MECLCGELERRVYCKSGLTSIVFRFKVNLPLHLQTQPGIIKRTIFDRLLKQYVLMIPGESFDISSDHSENTVDVPMLRASFSMASAKQLEEAMEIFAKVLREFNCGRGATEAHDTAKL